MARKALRLRHYDYASPGAHFVTICTAGRRALLVGQTGEMLARYLCSLPVRFPGLSVDEHVVMGDHVHVIFLPDGSTPALSRIVQAFKSRTSLQVPRGALRLWQRGFYEHVIRDEDELALVREYVHNNPLAETITFGE